MVEASEEAQVFAACQARIEAEVAPCVVTELAANGAGIANSIVARDLCAALRGQKERRKNAEQRGFACAICAEQGESFARPHFERKSGESHDRWFFEWLQKGTPAAARGGK